jgi:hypothetical protein
MKFDKVTLHVSMTSVNRTPTRPHTHIHSTAALPAFIQHHLTTIHTLLSLVCCTRLAIAALIMLLSTYDPHRARTHGHVLFSVLVLQAAGDFLVFSGEQRRHAVSFAKPEELKELHKRVKKAVNHISKPKDGVAAAPTGGGKTGGNFSFTPAPAAPAAPVHRAPPSQVKVR